MFGGQETSLAANTVRYMALNSVNLEQATEANSQITMDFPFLIRRMRVFVTANTLTTAPAIVGIRVNAVTRASVSVTAAANGEFATGTLTIPVVVGDLVNYIVDSTGAGGTDVDVLIYLYIQRVVE